MDFIIDSGSEEFSDKNSDIDQEECDSEQNSFMPSTISEDGNSMGFSFIADDDDEENVLGSDESDSSASDDENDSFKVSIFQKEDKLENNLHVTNCHPLAHLFDEEELIESKPVSTKSNAKKIENNKNDSNCITHPLAHLFDEVELTENKPVLKNSNAKKIVGNKKKDTKPKQKSLSEKLYDGLTRKCKKNLQILQHDKKDDEINKLLAKSEILNSDPAEMFCVDPQISKRKLKKLKKEEQDKTKGYRWFGLPATEMTDEVKRDLELLKMRSVLDPKRFYKKNDLQVLPKYFQMGKVMDNPRDFYSHRLTKKERKKTLVDELMADAAFTRYNKNKYAEIVTEKQKTHYKAWRQAKRLKKKK